MPNQKQNRQLGATRRSLQGVKLIRTLEGHEGIVEGVAFDPTGRTLASGSRDETVRLWEVERGKLVRTLYGHENSVLSVMFDPTGRTLASGSGDETVRLWEVGSGKLLRAWAGDKVGCFSDADSSDERKVGFAI